jgi:hypothetical protein
MFIWHHIASVIIFFMVMGAFAISLYFAHLEFMAERKSPVDYSNKKFTAKFLGMEFSSSMIGLSILVISFAFFMAYLKWVYPIKSTQMDSSIDTRTLAAPASASGASTNGHGG